MMDNNNSGGDKQQHNNQTVHGRVRRKRIAVNGSSTNDYVNQLTQQSTNNGDEQIERW